MPGHLVKHTPDHLVTPVEPEDTPSLKMKSSSPLSKRFFQQVSLKGLKGLHPAEMGPFID